MPARPGSRPGWRRIPRTVPEARRRRGQSGRRAGRRRRGGGAWRRSGWQRRGTRPGVRGLLREHS
ncbi:MAG: chromosome segregation protein SMC, partial [Bacteroidetes bacterium]